MLPVSTTTRAWPTSAKPWTSCSTTAADAPSAFSRSFRWTMMRRGNDHGHVDPRALKRERVLAVPGIPDLAGLIKSQRNPALAVQTERQITRRGSGVEDREASAWLLGKSALS